MFYAFILANLLQFPEAEEALYRVKMYDMGAEPFCERQSVGYGQIQQ